VTGGHLFGAACLCASSAAMNSPKLPHLRGLPLEVPGMSATDPAPLIAAALAELPPGEQTGLMVLTMRAHIRSAREAGMTDADIE